MDSDKKKLRDNRIETTQDRILELDPASVAEYDISSGGGMHDGLYKRKRNSRPSGEFPRRKAAVLCSEK